MFVKIKVNTNKSYCAQSIQTKTQAAINTRKQQSTLTLKCICSPRGLDYMHPFSLPIISHIPWSWAPPLGWMIFVQNELNLSQKPNGIDLWHVCENQSQHKQIILRTVNPNQSTSNNSYKKQQNSLTLNCICSPRGVWIFAPFSLPIIWHIPWSWAPPLGWMIFV